MTAGRLRHAGVRRCRSERGVGTVLTAGALMGLVAVATAVCIIVTWLAQARQAQDAADLVALAAAGAEAGGSKPCAAARDAARRNGVRLVSCELSGHRPSFVVNVEVQLPLRPTVPGFPTTLNRGATAGSA